MAGDPIPIEYRVNLTYTLSEAVELEKIYQYTNTRINWVNTRTGQPVVIGWT